MPIEWNEPFGIVFAEALACGTPVISCPRGALPEIVRQGVDGFLVTSIEEACNAVAKIEKIDRRNCRKRAEDCFSARLSPPNTSGSIRSASRTADEKNETGSNSGGTFSAEQLGGGASLTTLGPTSARIRLGADRRHDALEIL